MTIRIFFPLGSHPATGANNRLASDGTYRYLYDNEGNRTRRFVDNNANGLLDAGDTQITEYAWDHRDRLTQVTSRAVYGGAATRLVAYTYDVFDHVIARNHDADGAGPQGMQPTFYAYDGDQIILEFNGVQATNLTHRYLWGPAVDQLLADEQVSSLNTPGNVIWPLADNLGTTRDLAVYDALTNTTTVANHRVYDAYGNLKSETNAAVDEVFGYTGRLFDESTGLQNNWERWYDPKVGSWASEDPIGFAGGDGNLKRYVGNGPTNATDPSGLANFWNPFTWGIPTPQQGWGGFFNPLGESNPLFATTGGLIKGGAQGTLDTVNGVQDGLIGILNTPAVAWNFTAGKLGGGKAGYLHSPDWSQGLIVDTGSTAHAIGKFCGGQGVIALATGGIGNAAKGSQLFTVARPMVQADGRLSFVQTAVVVSPGAANATVVGVNAASIAGNIACMQGRGNSGGTNGGPGSNAQLRWEEDLARGDRIANEMARRGYSKQEIARWKAANSARAAGRKQRLEDGLSDTLPRYPAPWE